MKVFSMAVAASAALLATSAHSQQIQTPPSDKQEKKICRTDRTTGSLTRRTRICMTQREWDAAADGTRKGVETLQRDGHQATLERERALLPGGGGW